MSGPLNWERVGELFERAREVPPEELGSWLDHECGDDATIRAELASLLERVSDSEGYLDRLRAAVVEPMAGGLIEATASSAFEVPTGTKLGVYEVLEVIGEGGMATVYLARDTRHHRDVALKVLRPELSATLGRQRFLREIEIAAALSHPHVLPVFDSGESEDLLYYVTPYIEGESLRHRLEREKQLPIEEAVRLTEQAASALTYAHGQGVVHRDIKPENILLSGDQAVVADFGIAQALEAAGSQRLTGAGLAVGTPAYMSPEQALGTDVDARSDVYALGCVLYEMLVGEPPFVAKSSQATLLKIATDEPRAVTDQRKSVPPNVAGAVSKALEKLPADRFTSAEALARALGDPGFVYRGGATHTIERSGWQWTRLTTVVTMLAIALGIVTGWVLLGDGRPVTRLSLDLPDGESLLPRTGGRLSIAPEGRRFAYAGGPWPGWIWIRDLDQLQATALPGTEGGFWPTISPDGQRVAFRQGSSVLVAHRDGRPAITLAGDADGMIDWGPDGFVYMGSRGLFRVPEGGGEWELVIPEDEAGRDYLNPDILPNGRAAVFTLGRPQSPPGAVIAVADFETAEVRTLTPGVAAVYSNTGHLLVVQADGTLNAVPFDQDALVFTGPARPVGTVTDISQGGLSPADLSLSETGTLLYATGARVPGRQIVWVDQAGVERPADPEWTGPYESVALSPDGRRLAVGTEAGYAGSEIWIKTPDEGPMTRLTLEGELNRRPVWSEDGEWVTFISERGDHRAVYRKRSDGVGDAEVVLELPEHVDEVDWSPGGEWLVYRTGIEGGEVYGTGPQAPGDRGRDIHAWHIGGDSSRIPVAANPAFDEMSPALSPDGRWIAYVSTESGESAVYVRSFPDVDAYRTQISSGGGYSPVWAADGATLYYGVTSAPGRRLMAVDVTLEPTFRAGEPRVLFSTWPYLESTLHQTYDVGDDGTFVMIRVDDAPARSDLILVQNFSQELKRATPD